MTIFATVGYPGSGKGEAASVAGKTGVPVVIMGDVIRRACRARGLPITERNLGHAASSLRDREGRDAIARRCLTLVEMSHRAYGVVLIDGIRGAAEVDCFRRELGDDFELLAIEAPFEVRLDRVRVRGRDATATDADDLRERDERERGYGMDDAIEMADVRIDNTGSLVEFHERLASLFEGVSTP